MWTCWVGRPGARAGGEGVMVRGSPFNLKVTRPEDLALAELFLREEAG